MRYTGPGNLEQVNTQKPLLADNVARDELSVELRWLVIGTSKLAAKPEGVLAVTRL